MKPKQRVLIIAVDGFTWRLGRRFMSEGLMPALSSLVAGGTSGDLQSVTPFETGPAWSSFQTGCKPGKTGVFSFHTFDRKMGKIRLNSFDDIAAPSIWELADRAGRKVVSINMPVSSPPPKVNGVIIPGLLCPELSVKTTHPPEAYDKYIAPRKDYMIVNHAHRETVAEVTAQSIAVERARLGAALEIMNDIDWDIFSFQMQSGDLMQHRIWWALDESADGFDPGDYEQATGYYRCCDEIIADLIKAAGEDVLTIIVSDHGFCSLKGSVHINNWLRIKGYLKLPEKDPPTSWETTKEKIPPLKLLARLGGSLHKQAGELFDKAATVITGAEKQIPFSEVELKHLRQLIDFERTQAFCLGSMGGMLYVNDRGGQKTELCAKIAEELLQDMGPQSKNPAITSIRPAAEVYDRHPNVETMPDLVVDLAQGYSAVINPTGQNTLSPHIAGSKQDGTHDRYGVLVVNGPGVKQGLKLNAQIVDIVPTVLAYMGIPTPSHLDGKAIQEAFCEPLAISYQDVEFSSSAHPDYTDDEQAEVEKHLTDLGYL